MARTLLVATIAIGAIYWTGVDCQALGAWTAWSSSSAVVAATRPLLARALKTTDVCVLSVRSSRSQVVAGTNVDVVFEGCSVSAGANVGECVQPCPTPRQFLARVFDQPWTGTTRLLSLVQTGR
jgi:hypothetical protein